MAKLIKGTNDLKTEYPEVAKEWNYEKNGSLKPEEIRAGSAQKVWWICKNGHEWQSAIDSRTKWGRECPYCSGRKLLSGYNDFETWCKNNGREVLLKEWNFEKNDIQPNQVSPKVAKKVWWKCSLGHEWESTINSRNGRVLIGCPYCSGHKTLAGYNDFETWCNTNNKENLLKEWDYDKNEFLPNQISPHNNKKVWWKCSLGHEWKTSIGDRTGAGNNCPICSGRITLAGFNDFETWCINNGRRELLYEWDREKNELEPNQISPKNNKKIWWKCSLGHEWEATLGSRTGKKPSGCPYCSIPVKKILVGFNDFETKCKENGREYLLDEWNYERNTDVTPRSVTYSSGKRIWWKCKKGHEWKTSISGRTEGRNCPVCSRTSTSFPEQAIAFYLSKKLYVLQRYSVRGYELDIFLEDYNIGIEYDGIRYHSSKKAELREKEKNRFFKDRGISVLRLKECTGDANIKTRDVVYYKKQSTLYLEESFNRAIKELFSIIEEKIGSVLEIDVDVVRDELLIREHYLSELKKGSVATLFPELVSEWDIEKNGGLSPEYFSAMSHTKVWWKCDKGHSWQANISSRSRKLGCPYCAGQRLIVGSNDLESWCVDNNPIMLKEWD